MLSHGASILARETDKKQTRRYMGDMNEINAWRELKPEDTVGDNGVGGFGVGGGGCIRLGCWEKLSKGLLKGQEEPNGKMIPGPTKS